MDDNKKCLLCFGCDFSGWYNFGKIVKIVATRCHILKLKCTKFDFGWGCAPYPPGGAYSAPPYLGGGEIVSFEGEVPPVWGNVSFLGGYSLV